jgi:C4-dicarboxylate-specific signal transduction histidine kinase
MISDGKGRVRSWQWLLLSFAVIAVLFGVTNLVTWQRGRRFRSEIELAMRDSVASAELVARIGRDLDGERQLIDTHIAEKERIGMSLVEARMAELQRDFTVAAAAYTPLADQSEEANVWQELQTEVATAAPYIAAVLEYSRDNRDAEARSELQLVDRHFSRISDYLTRLMELNRQGAAAALRSLDTSQARLNLVLGALALAGIALTTVLGAGAIRLVHQRELQLTHYSSMLETRNHELDAFAGRVAHDLRGPLTSMRMGVWRLSNGAPPEAMSIIEPVNRSILRMESLIGDLLALSRIDAQARGGVCDPAAVVSAVRDELTPRLEPLAANLRVDVAPARVRCGEGLLAAAVTNLADNALKYRRPDAPPEVAVTGRDLGRSYELRIADNGMGMSPDESRQAFAPFYRARRDPDTPGTGLGLSIVKRIIEANGGDIAIESALGKGTTFVMHLRTER